MRCCRSAAHACSGRWHDCWERADTTATAAAAARAEAEQAARALDAAKHALARAEAEREAAELKRHADLLAGRLEATIIALQALPPQLRRWGAPASLLNRLNVMRFYASIYRVGLGDLEARRTHGRRRERMGKCGSFNCTQAGSINGLGGVFADDGGLLP